MKTLDFDLSSLRTLDAPELALAFDQYQRYAVIAEWVGRLAPASTGPIIELGANTHGGLSRFFPGRKMVLLDRELAEGVSAPPNFVLGDATDLRLPDQSFEFAVSCDVLEHVPNSLRERFLRESFRVGARGAIHAFPVAGAETTAAEEAASGVWRRFFGEPFRWLEEHKQEGLPELSQTLEQARSITPHVVTFSADSLCLWLPLMKMHFLKEARRELVPLVRALDRFYNERLFEADHAQPCYRTFVALLRSGDDAERLQQWLRDRPRLNRQAVENDRNLLEQLAAAAEALVSAVWKAEKTVGERDHLVDVLNRVVATRDGWVSKLNQAVAQRDERLAVEVDQVMQQVAQRDQEIARLRQTLSELEMEKLHLTQSHSWRMTRPVRAAFRQYQRAQETLGRARERPSPPAEAPPVPSSIPADRNDYQEWIRRYDTLTDETRAKMRARIAAFAQRPLVSVVMPTYNTKPEWLHEAIESVRTQIYPHWELCIADDASTDPATRALLEEYGRLDKRIKIDFRQRNGHISAASNSALALATGDYVALLDHDDRLSEHALFWSMEAIDRHPDAGVVYSDEDKFDDSNRRSGPYFKCAWNYDLFLTYNMICHLGVYRRDLLVKVGGFREGFEGSQDYDLALRCIEQLHPDQIVHVPRILYHWRMHAASTSQALAAKPYALLAGERAIQDHFDRKRVNAVAEAQPLGFVRVRYALPAQPPRVTLIIPTRNMLRLLRTCITTILEKTTYPNYEILIVDNGSDDPAALTYFELLQSDRRVRVLRDDRPFNYSSLNNRAVREAQGELVALVNNDIEVIHGDWLSEMVSVALQPGVGAVGARLWYPNDTLQHGGVILGLDGVAGHSHWGSRKPSTGYFQRAGVRQALSAVTAACLVIRKSTFLEVGGLDEENLKIAFNDVDFCLRVLKAGYRNVWTPFAELYHHESASRGYEDTPDKKERFAREVLTMQRRWNDILSNDPAYSPNLSLVFAHAFSFAWPPRVPSV